MESFSMTRLDIGWVTHAQKPEFALSTYSRKFLAHCCHFDCHNIWGHCLIFGFSSLKSVRSFEPIEACKSSRANFPLRRKNLFVISQSGS
jgi:hypothetical protein